MNSRFKRYVERGIWKKVNCPLCQGHFELV